MHRPTRRALLRTAPATLAALAGCEALTGNESTPTPRTAPTSTKPTNPEHGITVRNQTAETQYVSVAVTDGTEVVGSETVEVEPDGRTEIEVASPPGRLSVAIETATGRTASHLWMVGESLRDLVVTLTADAISFAQSAWCTPACPPLSTGGTSAEFPFYGDDPAKMSYYGANVTVTNETDATLDVELRIEYDGEPILDYAYVIPPDLTLEFPGVHAGGDYVVHVESPLGQLRYDWRPPKERHLKIRLGRDGVRATCGTLTAALVLANDDSIPHELEVSATRPGSDRVLFRRRYLVQPGAHYDDPGVFTGSGQYDLRVTTSAGAATTYDWWLCPPRGPTEITVQAGGSLHVVQYQPG